MIVAYNGITNEPIINDIIPNFSTIPVLNDEMVLRHGIVKHDEERKDFLNAEANQKSFEQEIK